MELLIILALFALIIAAFVSAIAMGGWAILAAGYYLTLPALGLITAVVVGVWGVVYYRAPWHPDMGRYGERKWDSKLPKSDILFRGYIIGGVLLVVWTIAFFANWQGTELFFNDLGHWLFRSGS